MMFLIVEALNKYVYLVVKVWALNKRYMKFNTFYRTDVITQFGQILNIQFTVTIKQIYI